VPRAKFNDLVHISGEYHALRTTLITAGIDPKSLDILASNKVDPPAAEQQETPRVEDATADSKWADAPIFVPSGRRRKLANITNAPVRCDTPLTPPSLSQDLQGGQPQEDTASEVEESYEQEEEEVYHDNHEDRSIVVRGLPQQTCLADVVKVIRGGVVLNMYLRPRDRTAHIAFVDPIAAEKFIIHSKRSDIYVKGKRVCLVLPMNLLLLTKSGRSVLG
jgi:hypothetical protein